MTVVDCAHDDDLASELMVYFTKHGHDAKLGDSSIITIQNKNTRDVLKAFLKGTERKDYTILESDVDFLSSQSQCLLTRWDSFHVNFAVRFFRTKRN